MTNDAAIEHLKERLQRETLSLKTNGRDFEHHQNMMIMAGKEKPAIEERIAQLKAAIAVLQKASA